MTEVKMIAVIDTRAVDGVIVDTAGRWGIETQVSEGTGAALGGTAGKLTF